MKARVVLASLATSATLALASPDGAPGVLRLGVLRVPYLPPIVVSLPVVPIPSDEPQGDAGTESFEALRENGPSSPRLGQVPDDIFRTTLTSKEASERIAKDALPKKEEPSVLEQILVPLTVLAAEAADARH